MNPTLLSACTDENVPKIGSTSSAPYEVGDRFFPTDEELVDHYLKLKSLGKDDEVRKIPELDFYQFDPWELPYFSGTNLNRREAFFFSYLYAKHPGSNSGRINRSTKSGSWEASGRDGEIVIEGTGVRIGTKKIFIHSERRDGIKFVMHEYSASSNSSEKRTLVLCKVMKKPVKKAKISNEKYKRSRRKTQIPSCDPSCNANPDFDGHDPNMNIDCSTRKKEGEPSSRMTFEIENKELDDATCIEGEAIHNQDGYQNINTSTHNDDNTNHAMTFAPENSVADAKIPKGIDSEILSHGDSFNYEDDPLNFAFDPFAFTEQGPPMLGMSVPIFGECQLYQSEEDKVDCQSTTPDSAADVTIPKGISCEISTLQDILLKYPNMNIACSTRKKGESSSRMTFEIENKELDDATCIEGEVIHNENGYQNINTSTHNDDNTNHTLTCAPENSVADVTIPKGIDPKILPHGDGFNYEDDPLNFAFYPFAFTEQVPFMLSMSVPIFGEHQLYQSEGGEMDYYTTTPDSVADVTIPEGISCEISSVQDILLGHNQRDYGINYAQGSPMCAGQNLCSLGNYLAVPGGNTSNMPEEDPFNVHDSLWS